VVVECRFVVAYADCSQPESLSLFFCWGFCKAGWFQQRSIFELEHGIVSNDDITMVINREPVILSNSLFSSHVEMIHDDSILSVGKISPQTDDATHIYSVPLTFESKNDEEEPQLIPRLMLDGMTLRHFLDEDKEKDIAAQILSVSRGEVQILMLSDKAGHELDSKFDLGRFIDKMAVELNHGDPQRCVEVILLKGNQRLYVITGEFRRMTLHDIDGLENVGNDVFFSVAQGRTVPKGFTTFRFFPLGIYGDSTQRTACPLSTSMETSFMPELAFIFMT